MDKITIERETVELAASLIQPLTGKGDREVYDALRAALAAQPAEPVAWRWKERVNGMSDSDWTVTNVEPPDGVRVIAKEPLYAAQPAPAAVPPGYALVPIEPTHGMLSALTQEWHPSKHGPMKQRYRAMIAAAGDKP